MKVNLAQYRSLYSPFCHYMFDHHPRESNYNSWLVMKVLAEQFNVICTIEPRSKLWLVDMSEEEYVWFKLRWDEKALPFYAE